MNHIILWSYIRSYAWTTPFIQYWSTGDPCIVWGFFFSLKSFPIQTHFCGGRYHLTSFVISSNFTAFPDWHPHGYCVSATPCRANILPMSVLPRYHASVYCPRFKGSPKFPGSLVEKSSLHSVNSRTPARSANKTKPKVPEGMEV